MRIIFTSQDPGGCDSILPVIKQFSEQKKDQIICIVSQKSKDILEREHVDYVDANILTKEQIRSEIDCFKPDIVLTGTSFGLSIEKLIIRYCTKNNIRVASIVDYWSNYWHRFRFENEDYLPNKIFVIDTLMKKEMISEGFDEDMLIITGNPTFDSYGKLTDDTKMIKNRILFISQPFTEIKDQKIGIGYDEMEALSDVLEVMSDINDESGRSLDLFIRPHPKEKPEKFQYLLNKFRARIKIHIDDNQNIMESISQARIIIGMSSMVLFQAAMGMKKVISYQPNVKKDLSILNKLGISKTIRKKEDLAIKIRQVLNQKIQEHSLLSTIEKYVKNNSTKKVLNTLRRMVE